MNCILLNPHYADTSAAATLLILTEGGRRERTYNSADFAHIDDNRPFRGGCQQSLLKLSFNRLCVTCAHPAVSHNTARLVPHCHQNRHLLPSHRFRQSTRVVHSLFQSCCAPSTTSSLTSATAAQPAQPPPPYYPPHSHSHPHHCPNTSLQCCTASPPPTPPPTSHPHPSSR